MAFSRRFFSLAYGIFALIAAMTVAFFVGTVAALPFAVLPRGVRERYSNHATVWFSWIVVRCVLLNRPNVTYASGGPPSGPALLVCNHRSWLDVLYLAWLGRASGLSKSSVLFIPFIGYYAWLGGAVFFNRNLPDARAQARADVLAQLEAGHRIFVFPEGTRTRDGLLREKVHLTLVRDCFARGIDVVPCAVMNTENVIPVSPPGVFPGRSSSIRIGKALHPTQYDDADHFAHAVWSEVVASVGLLMQGREER
jgi:1-acyl-sn-glycerol-3-phosphate acyltransferase